MSVPELIDNIFQLVVVLSVSLIGCIFAIKKSEFIPIQYLCGCSICFFIATAYWTIYFLIYGEFVYYFSASEICYMGSYLFVISLSLMFFKQSPKIELSIKQKLLCLILPSFVFMSNLTAYLMCGGLLWTLYYALPLMIISFLVSRNFFTIKSKNIFRFNLIMSLFVVFNNMMFLFSSFGFNRIYILFDFLLTLTFPFMLFFIKKESDL